MQYSARFTDAVNAEIEEINTIRPPAALCHPPRRQLRQKMRSLQIGGNQFVEALFRRVQNVAPFPRSNPRIIYQQIEAVRKNPARERDQRSPVLRLRNIAPENLAARFRPQRLRFFQAAEVSRNHPVRLRKLERNAASYAPAGAGNDSVQVISSASPTPNS